MYSKLRPFSEMFEGWPIGVAEYGPDLINIDFDVLRHTLEQANVDPEVAKIVYDLRNHAFEIRNALTAEPALASAADVAKVLGKQLRPPKDRWITYPLDATRRRVTAPHKHSGSRYLCYITAKVPGPDDLAPLPDGGVYLLVRNDTPAVFNINGVVRRIESLAKAVPLADVILYDTTDEDNPVVSSLRNFVGARGLEPVPLEIEAEYAEKVRTLW
jgi:hypothetical protein